MSRDYTPRRCGKRWLDGDCPPEVLCIIDNGNGDPAPERFDVIYTTVDEVKYEGSLTERWMYGYCISDGGSGYHIEMRAHEVAAYRYRMKNKYTRWSTLPDAVKAAVRRDIKQAEEFAAEHGAGANAGN